MDEVLTSVGGMLVLATWLPLWRHPARWLRMLDFPRLQIACALALLLPAHLLWAEPDGTARTVQVLLAGSLAWQLARIRPYTRFARRQVQAARTPQPEHTLRLLFANVLQTNRRADALLAIVRAHDPDVVLALEADEHWDDALQPLAATHPHTVRQPQGNTYGMLLYSRLPLVGPRLRFLVEPDVPSIHTGVRLRDGRLVQLHALHPRPPAPGEARSARPRDAELLVVGREIRRHPEPVVVMGDLNDVAWSHTSRLFREISGLLDPRIGRGLFNTFHAGHRWLRFPLDHFFHSNHFRLVDFRRGAFFGSDHFPVCIHLSLEPQATEEQPRPQADAGERAEAARKIDEAVGGDR